MVLYGFPRPRLCRCSIRLQNVLKIVSMVLQWRHLMKIWSQLSFTQNLRQVLKNIHLVNEPLTGHQTVCFNSWLDCRPYWLLLATNLVLIEILSSGCHGALGRFCWHRLCLSGSNKVIGHSNTASRMRSWDYKKRMLIQRTKMRDVVSSAAITWRRCFFGSWSSWPSGRESVLSMWWHCYWSDLPSPWSRPRMMQGHVLIITSYHGVTF